MTPSEHEKRIMSVGQWSSLAGPAPLQDQEKPVDNINPKHYRNHPSGVECIQVTRHMNFNIGNAVKYLWRHKDKNVNVETQIEDLEKAVWYINDEIQKLRNHKQP